MAKLTEFSTGFLKMRQGTVIGILALFVTLLPIMLTTESVHAQTFTVLHQFKGPDGGHPVGGLTWDSAGNLYGTTTGWGSFGTVFKLNKAGKLTVLHRFGSGDGEFPLAGLVRDSVGNLYGTTAGGGNLDCYNHGPEDCGTVFKVTRNGVYTVLYEFRGDDGGLPWFGTLLRDAKGSLYGTTDQGGAYNRGTVFTVDTIGKESVLYSFKGDGKDGGEPVAGLVRDAKGNFYGTATCCAGEGIVFKLDTTGKETVLHYFDGADGAFPYAGLIFDRAGNLYGTTQAGGIPGCYIGEGCGVVFKLTPKPGGRWKEKVLYKFTGGKDGADPWAGLILDVRGNLYGTTREGGSSRRGVVFQLDPTGKETVLHSFTGGADGKFPDAGLIFDQAGNLYGTTFGGGYHNQGVVFKVTP